MKDIYSNQGNCIKIKLANAIYSCRVLGKGDKKVIAFHGFGQNGNAFLPLAVKSPEFTIYSFELPYHGETIIRNPTPCYSPLDSIDLIQNLLDLMEIDRFSVIGYSIGAKMVYPILAEFSNRIDHAWLLAPDGIKENNWYKRATGSRLSRSIFRGLLNNYPTLKRLGNSLASLHVIRKEAISFALRSINTSQKRAQVFHLWTYLRKLKFKPKETATKLNLTNMSIFIVIGERDSVISKSAVEPFTKVLPNARTIVLECGHHRMIETFADWIVEN